MVESKDIALGIAGLALSFYGGKTNDQFLVVSGILMIILTIYFRIEQQDEDIKILQAQINTKSELNRIWGEINEIKNAKIRDCN